MGLVLVLTGSFRDYTSSILQEVARPYQKQMMAILSAIEPSL